MNLPVEQREALTELINIGYGKAGAALSELTGQRVLLEVPRVDVYFIGEIQRALREVFKAQVWTVQQFFSGSVSGTAMLLADEKAAHELANLVVPEALTIEEAETTAHEVLTEVANIVLHAALGACGDLLRVNVTMSVPTLQIEMVDKVLSSVAVEKEELQYALLIRTRFRILEGQVSGYLVLVLGVTSFTRLMGALEEWHNRQP